MKTYENPQKWFRIYFPVAMPPLQAATKTFRLLGLTFMWGEGNFNFKMPYFMVVWNKY